MGSLATLLDREILPRVEKPSRYLGCELNSVHKDPAAVEVRIALAFPDLYDLGLSNLGLLILYGILNRLPGVWAERVYMPAPDLEALLQARGLPLFSLESKTPLRHFDAIGFTLQYELSYTNILQMLALSGLPLRTAQRDADLPLVLAGGPGAFHPEPLADFIDAFVIGDGEEVVVELVAALREAKGLRRDEQLRRLAAVPGVYVPALYPLRRTPQGELLPDTGGQVIAKRSVASLDTAPFPTDYVVPFTAQVHDRVSLEVLRGCTQGCRFCQAGMLYRPVRERSLETLARLTTETIARTGYEEISLSSLSTCDYSQVRHLVDQAVALGLPEHVAISLPSLRLDSFAVELAEMVATVRKTGLTFAPEAATPRLRAVINKWIPDEELLAVTGEVFARGWEAVKLYFMIGLPTETDEDVRAIGRLARRVLAHGRQHNPRARVNLGVSTFVPKPFTPFQWERQISIEETLHKQALLQAETRQFGLKFGRHDAHMSFLEGVISRGDRQVGRLLEAAHRLGCRFDAWGEHFDFGKWQEAAARSGIDMAFYLRQRDLREPLPWDHIDCLVDKQYFIDEYWRSRLALLAEDCRAVKCHQCGVMDRNRAGCLTMLRASHEGRKREASWQRRSAQQRPQTQPQQKVRLRFALRGPLRLLSHLETVRLFTRALRRAGLPVQYSQGFHPQPLLSFATARPVGVESEAEYADVVLYARCDPEAVAARLQAVLPAHACLLAAWEVPLRAPALMALPLAAHYTVEVPRSLLPAGLGPLAPRVAALLAEEAVWVRRWHKKGPRRVNLRPGIVRLEVLADTPEAVVLEMLLHEGEAKPPEVVQALLGLEGEALRLLRVRKLETLVREEAELVPLPQYEPWAVVA
ncbi:MAG: B12-binding protein [Candidatus Tectimicrobiota bacterium]|nr:MAG: B12-binding protein [Candidatus Tectomicrobia bacterium]